MCSMRNLVILISGRGSNMQALVRARAQEQWPARIQAVISDRADAPGLAFAAAQRIRTVVVEARAHTRASFEAALMRRLTLSRRISLCWRALCAYSRRRSSRAMRSAF